MSVVATGVLTNVAKCTIGKTRSNNLSQMYACLVYKYRSYWYVSMTIDAAMSETKVGNQGNTDVRFD